MNKCVPCACPDDRVLGCDNAGWELWELSSRNQVTPLRCQRGVKPMLVLPTRWWMPPCLIVYPRMKPPATAALSRSVTLVQSPNYMFPVHFLAKPPYPLVRNSSRASPRKSHEHPKTSSRCNGEACDDRRGTKPLRGPSVSQPIFRSKPEYVKT